MVSAGDEGPMRRRIGRLERVIGAVTSGRSVA